ncbi:sulfurtransferase [Portibacter marinus]|uniref:sulfurtransferase n=1 Tax=Portibacter marinus TaxID=2898660 RepID=UPI001F35B5BC|nr:sulfurtransferase [Portibacter marinus]
MIKSVEWLNEHLYDEWVVILDARLPDKKERKTQIPGTRFFDLKGSFSDADSQYPNMMPNKDQFEAEARNLGINENSIIIVYDNLGIYTSARVWYMFRSMGHQEVYVLDGGLPEWIYKGYQTEAVQNHKNAKGNFIADFNADYFCNIDTVEENIESEEAILLDARSSGRFEGSAPEPRADLQSGNIPGSVSLPYTEVLENGKFKSRNQLEHFFQHNKPVIFSCGSGITACILLLASEIAQTPQKKTVFDGSWTEWAMKKRLMH